MRRAIFFPIVTLLIGTGSFSILSAQITSVKGNISGVLKAVAVNNLGKTFISYLEVNMIRADLENKLKVARQTYWALYERKQTSEAARQEYLEALRAKDIWLFSMDFMDYLYEEMGGGRKENDSRIAGWGSFVNLIQGGKVDGGVEPQAENDYQRWKDAVIYYFDNNKSGLTDKKTLLKAFENSSDEYLTYVLTRDAVEYLYHNEHSPLESADADTWMKGYLMAFVSLNDPQTEQYVQHLYKVSTAETVKQQLLWFRKNVNIRQMKQGIIGTTLTNFEWSLAKTSSKLYALYLIKRRYLCDWKSADLVLQRRIKRYGETVVNKAIDEVWVAKNNLSQSCLGDPDIMDKRFRDDLQKGKMTLIYRSNDCLADALGPQTLWHDLVDMIPAKTTILKSKQTILDGLSNALPAEALQGKTLSDRYNLLTTVVNENLLLGAFYLSDSIGNALKHTDKGGLYEFQRETDKSKYYTKEYSNLQSSIIAFELLEGMAVAARDYTTYGVYAWSRTQNTTIPMGRLELAALEFTTFQKKYGNAALQAAMIKGTAHPKEPFFGSNDYSNLATAELQLLVKSNAGNQPNAANKLAVKQKYKQLVAAYDPTKYISPVIFDCDEARVELYGKATGSSLSISLYLKKNADYEIGGNTEFNIMLNELLVPVFKKYYPMFKNLRCELYYEGSYLTNDITELSQASWKKYQQIETYKQDRQSLMVFYANPKNGVYEIPRYPAPPGVLSDWEVNYHYNSLAGYRKSYFKNPSYYDCRDVYSWRLPYKSINPGDNCSDSMEIFRTHNNFSELKDTVQFLKQIKNTNENLLNKKNAPELNFCNVATLQRIVHVVYVADREVWRSWSGKQDNWSTVNIVYQLMENGQVVNRGKKITLR